MIADSSAILAAFAPWRRDHGTTAERIDGIEDLVALLTCDRRAAQTYRRMGAKLELI